MTAPSVLAVGSLVLAWLTFSIWIVADRVVYDRRLRAVREGRGGRLSWRVVARLAADSREDPALGDALARYVLERDGPGIVATAYGTRPGWRQVEALRLLARAGYPIGPVELERLLERGDDEVVATAATILADIPGDEATAALFRGLERGGTQTRWVAVLVERRGAPAELVRPLADDPKPEVREAALRLLGSTPDRAPWIVEELERRCRDALPDVRAAAARALGRRGEPTASETLDLLLDDPMWFVQVQAARALGRLGAAASIRRLASLLASDEWWVRQAAKDALVALGPRVSGELVDLLAHPDDFARNGLAEVLQNVGFVDELVADVEAAPVTVTSNRSETILRDVLAAGGPQFAAAVLAQMQPGTRFDSFLTDNEPEARPEVRAA